MRLTRRDFAAGLVAGYCCPLHHRKRAGARCCHHQDRHVRAGDGPRCGIRRATPSRAPSSRSRPSTRPAVSWASRPSWSIEDDQTTNPGIVLAFSKLAAQSDIVAFLGSIRSTQVHAMAPDVLKLGKPVMIGGTDPNLTHMGNQWLFRFRPNDSYSGRVIAEYGVNTLGKKKWAVLHSTDAFGTAGGKALSAALEKLGCPAVLDQGYANQSQDFTPVVLAIKQSGADILGSYFTFENDLGIFARQLRQLGVNIPWVGSPSIVNITALKLAGPALFGTFGVADYAEDFVRRVEDLRQGLSRSRQGRARQPELLDL